MSFLQLVDALRLGIALLADSLIFHRSLLGGQLNAPGKVHAAVSRHQRLRLARSRPRRACGHGESAGRGPVERGGRSLACGAVTQCQDEFGRDPGGGVIVPARLEAPL